MSRAKLAAVPLAEFDGTAGQSGRYQTMPETSGSSLLTTPNSLSFKYDSLEEAFPAIDPGIKPVGACVLVQIRQPKRMSAGGVLLPGDARSTEHYNTQIAIVRDLGPLCFMTVKEIPAAVGEVPRDVMVPFVEGPWFKIGDYVRVPRYGGDRFDVPYDHVYRLKNPETDHFENKTEREEIIFVLFKSKDVIGLVTGNPLTMKAFLD